MYVFILIVTYENAWPNIFYLTQFTFNLAGLHLKGTEKDGKYCYGMKINLLICIVAFKPEGRISNTKCVHCDHRAGQGLPSLLVQNKF